MKKLLILLALVGLLSADEESKKVVFDLTTGDIKTLERKLISGTAFHKTYYEGKLESLDVAVVIHGDAYKFFVKDLARSPYREDKRLKQAQKDLHSRLATLSKMYDIEFIMCASGMKKLKLGGNIYAFVTLAATSTVGLIDKQAEGYAYIPIR